MPRKMKDSGIPWVGKIPEDWEVTRLQKCFNEVLTLNSDGAIKNALKFYLGTIIEKVNFDPETDPYVADITKRYTVVNAGDIILNGLNLNFDFVSMRVGRVGCKGAITSAYIALRAIPDTIVSDYATYLLKSYDHKKAFHNMGTGVRKILTFRELKKQMLLRPPRDEQKRIADYLDKTVGRIDGLREKISREIERLGDYKKSVISEAVCRGLDKNAKMKDSGIPWVGKIPAGWEVTRGKYCLRLLNRQIKDDDGVITCFRDGEVTLRSKRREEGFTVSLKECGYQGVEPGDLVVHGMDGFAGSIGISDSRGKASPVLNVIDSNECKKYIMYYLRSMAYRDVFLALSTGIRVRSCDLRWNKLANLQYILPPLAEQKRIAEYIDKQVARIDALIEKRKAELERLEALKRSIICECVTGKREVA